MKKFVSLFLSLFILISLPNSALALDYAEEWDNYSSESGVLYTDVPKDHWAFENVTRVSQKNWFSGYPDGTFRPNGQITRAEALKVFVVFLGMKLEDITETSYHDIKVTDWYAPYVEAGKDLFPPRVTISGDAPFQPNMPVTREDTIYALVKALGYEENTKFADESVLNMFSDQNSISTHIKPYVATAVSMKLVSGRTDGTIGAQDPLTRAEFATLLYRASHFGFNTVKNAVLQSVIIDNPSTITLLPGETVTITATASYSDGTTAAYTNLNPYNNDDNDAVTINRNTITAANPGNCEIRFNDSNLEDTFIVIIVQEAGGNAPSISVDYYDESTIETSTTISGYIECETTNNLTLTCNNEGVYVHPDGTFSVTVTLQEGSNRFKLVASNPFGSANENVIITREKPGTAPRITINTYKNKTNNDTITISGKVTSDTNSPIEFTCNGISVDLQSNGKFSTELDLYEGENYFDFWASNEFGDTNKTIMIKMEVTGDAPTITLNAYDSVTESEKVNIKGKITSDSEEPFELYCNNDWVEVYPNGNFTYDLYLTEGENQFDFVVSNRFGKNIETIYITQEFTGTSPTITINNYDNVTSQDFLTIKGKVTSDNTHPIELYCNGEWVDINYNGSFSYDAWLEEGENQFDFTASNRFGETTETIFIEYEPDIEEDFDE